MFMNKKYFDLLRKGSPTSLNEQLDDMKFNLDRAKARLKYKKHNHNDMEFSHYWPKKQDKVVDEDAHYKMQLKINKWKR